MKKKQVLKGFFYTITSLFVIGIVSLFSTIAYFSKDLPNHKKLKNYNPAVTTRLYSADGKFLKEYAKEKRLFVPIEQIPDVVKYAFISAEDASFYNHIGISPKAIIVAGFENVVAKAVGRGKIRGGSTITQQVAKNFLLTNERTLSRKIKEAILSIRMTQAFSKDKILELYLNQIFLGNRSYGVASASLNYFNKSLDELTIDESALLASLPKAPAKLDPTRNDQDDVIERRNWVIDRMESLNYITKDEADKAKAAPIVLREKSIDEVSNGEFFSEEVRKEIVKMYGEDSLLNDGHVVITTLEPKLQQIADEYLKKGIEAYDVRHGYRGVIDNISGEIDFKNNWGELINKYVVSKKYRNDWDKAVVLGIDKENERVIIGVKKIEYNDSFADKLENNEFILTSNDDKLLILGYIPLNNLKWARKYISVDEIGPEIKSVTDIGFKVGDVIMVQKNNKIENEYFLRQIPEVNGALVAMNPHNGKVLAMMGGYIDSQMDFNRATQAERQPGSTMKTFAYLAALENGYTPASIIIDEEIELDQGIGRPPYKPRNNAGAGIYYGPTTLRVGLEKSINVTTIRLASEVGINKVAEVVKRFGINDKPQRIYSLVLGSTETNLLKMVRAYAMIVNGGKEIQPALIEKIQDKQGKTIFIRDKSECAYCHVDKDTAFEDIIIPVLVDNRKDITDSATAYQMTNMLEGVVQRGTGWRAKGIGKPVGAKTGTTNDGKDAWFVGFSPDLAVGVYIGFDRPEYMGLNEMGSSVAGPIFVNFMRNALKDVPSVPFRVPPTVNLVRIDTKTGYYPTPDSNPKDIVLEAFKPDDKIVKFEQEMSDEDIDNYMQYQDSTQINRPVIITNIQKKSEIDNQEEVDSQEEYDNQEEVYNQEEYDGEIIEDSIEEEIENIN